MPEHHQPVQRVRLTLLIFMAMAVFIPPAFSLPALDETAVKPAATQGGGIVATTENGRKVYVNGASPETTTTSRPRARRSILVYWSNTDHRWKPVPTPTPAAMWAARHAAAEVRQYVTAKPRGTTNVANPNYATLARGYRVSSAEIDSAIDQAASKNGVDANLVRALIKVESNFNPNAVSHKGAMGLMQLMPGTASQLNVSNPFDPQQNVEAGVRHLKHLLTNFNGDVRLSLAAYNAGEGAVARNGGVPPYAETQSYVKRITDLYWNQSGRVFGPFNAPVHMYRGKDGVLRMTNTE